MRIVGSHVDSDCLAEVCQQVHSCELRCAMESRARQAVHPEPAYESQAKGTSQSNWADEPDSSVDSAQMVNRTDVHEQRGSA